MTISYEQTGSVISYEDEWLKTYLLSFLVKIF